MPATFDIRVSYVPVSKTERQRGEKKNGRIFLHNLMERIIFVFSKSDAVCLKKVYVRHAQ
jgi:hypothetical protein